jgi:hypothetical protein
MFNKTIVIRQPYVRHTTTIHEHKAPTDESVKLLKEYQEKAHQWAEEAIAHTLTNIEATVVQFEKVSWDRTYKLCVKINGRQYNFALDEPQSRYGIEEEVKDAIARELTCQLFLMIPKSP